MISGRVQELAQAVLRHPMLLPAMAGAAVLGVWGQPAEAVGVICASGALAMTTGRSPRTEALGDPQRHLMWCRRREESANLAAFRLPRRDVATATALVKSLRVTDSFTVRSSGRYVEVFGVMDGPDLDRDAVERRLADALGEAVPISWAAFPEDGVTLEALLERARSASLGKQPCFSVPRQSTATGGLPALTGQKA